MNFKKMNKRAAVPVIIYWIAAIVIGIILAKQAGFFSISTYLPHPSASGKPSELVNLYFYDDSGTNPAINNYQFNCGLNSLVIRASSNPTSSIPNWLVLFRNGSYVGYPIITTNGGDGIGTVKNPSVNPAATPKVQYIPSSIYDLGDNLYIFKRDRNETLTNCMVCQSGTSPVLYKQLSTSGSCAGVVQDFVEFRTTDLTYGSGSMGYTLTPGANLEAFAYSTSGTVTSYDCSHLSSSGYSLMIDNLPGGWSTGPVSLWRAGSTIKICQSAGSGYSTKTFLSGGSVNVSPDPIDASKEIKYTVDYPICNIYDTIYNHYYYQYSKTATPAVPSNYLVAAPQSGTYEYYNDGGNGGNPYILTGQNYSCRDINADGIADVVLQSCAQNNGGNNYTTLQTCSSGQGCQWYSATSTSGLFGKPAIKCGNSIQWYTPSKQLCKYQSTDPNYNTITNNYYYETNIDGSSINQNICDTSYGGICVQDTNTAATKVAHCMLCSGGVSRCDPNNNKVIQTCSGSGIWNSAPACSGDGVCQLISSSYTCKSGFDVGFKACGGQNYAGLPTDSTQRYIRNPTNDGWITNGAQCRTSCDTNSPDKCTNSCNWIDWASCSSGFISYCDRNSDTGNVLSPTGYASKQCAYPIGTSPECNSLGTGCNQVYQSGKTYCISGHLKVGTTGGDPLTQAGVKLDEVYQCQIGCTESVPSGTATCNTPTTPPTSKCLRSNQIVCDGLFNKVQCNLYKDLTTPLAIGGAAPSHQYCDDSDTTRDALWKSYPPDCNGGMKCVDSTNIKSCDTSGYFDGRFTEDCSGNGCTETTPGQPQCNAAPICSGLSFTGDNFYGCEGTKISWPCNKVPANDYDGKKIVLGSPSILCDIQCTPTASSNTADRCQAACSGSQTCEGDNVIECNGGAKGNIKWGCNAKGCNTANSNCNSDCGGLNNLNGISDGYSCNSATQRYCYPVFAPGSTTNIIQRILSETPCVFGCNTATGKCNTQCSTNEIAAGQKCVSDDVYKCSSNGAQAATPSWNCNSKGCSADGINCQNECGPGVIGEEATYKCDGTTSRFCNTLYSDTLNPTVATQRIYVDTPCAFQCDSTLGKCKAQCSGGSMCANDNTIHECIAGSDTGKIINTCMARGCSVIAGQAVCTSDCSSADVDKGLTCVNSLGLTANSCTGSGCKVLQCLKNETTIGTVTYTQFYNATVGCGVSGCSYSGNQYRCIGNVAYANSFDCGTDSVTGLLNGLIYKTDAAGVTISPAIDNCAGKSANNSLSPYCKRGSGQCYYCEQSQIYCVNSGSNSGTSFTCINGTTGTITGQTTCNVGCHNGYCDKSFIMLPDTTNFPLSPNSNTGNINMQLTLKTSSSKLPVSGATLTAVLSGTGIQSQTQSNLKTLADGSLANPIQFGSLTKGSYSITITVQGYSSNNVQTIPVVMTDSFIVKKYLVDILYLIPGTSPTIEIQVISPNGAVPDALFVSSYGNMSTAPTVVRSTEHPDRWILTLPAGITPGDYLIGFKPSQNGVDQSNILEQVLKFTVAQPDLILDLNSPASTTPGKHEYVLSITGPGYDSGIIKTMPLSPDITPKATVTTSSGQNDIVLLDQGGGRYLFDYTFSTSATYTFNIEATKAGYGGGILSKPLQVSGSGTETPPATDGTGTTTTTTNSSGGIITYLIIGVGLVVVYLIFSSKGGRR